MKRLIEERRILWPASDTGRPRLKRFLNELKNDVTGFSSVQDLGFTTDGTRDLDALFGAKIFPFPKPVSVPKLAVSQITSAKSHDIVLDFFAGSGTTGQATLESNLADGGNRRFILVQLPEPTGNEEFPTIAGICRERVRRAAKKIHDQNPMFAGDTGFRAFRLASSNIRAWDPDPADFENSLLKNAGNCSRPLCGALA